MLFIAAANKMPPVIDTINEKLMAMSHLFLASIDCALECSIFKNRLMVRRRGLRILYLWIDRSRLAYREVQSDLVRAAYRKYCRPSTVLVNQAAP